MHLAPSCPTCRASLEPALPLCVACGALFPERSPTARACLVRHLPESGAAREEIERLLAAASGQDRESVSRYLRRAPALFLVPASASIALRLLERLTELGAHVELEEAVSPEVRWGAWARALWHDKLGLAALLGALGLGGLAALARGAGAASIWVLIAGVLAALDARRFRRRISLSPALLSRRLGLVSEGLARPAAALLGRARPGPLREALGIVLVEHARLLAAVARVLAGHPSLQAPFRETLDEAGQHTLRVAENALALEEVGETDAAELPERLARVRALGSAEAERQLRTLLVSRAERRARQEWLARAHALLLIRLEAIAERLRGLRQEVARRALELGTAEASPEPLLTGLGRELELAVAALTEVEQGLPQALPEVIAEVVAERR
jgi:hypothetical protein